MQIGKFCLFFILSAALSSAGIIVLGQPITHDHHQPSQEAAGDSQHQMPSENTAHPKEAPTSADKQEFIPDDGADRAVEETSKKADIDNKSEREVAEKQETTGGAADQTTSQGLKPDKEIEAESVPVKSHAENRPWIIKQPSYEETRQSAAAGKTHPRSELEWRNEVQRTKCLEQLNAINDVFLKVRYHSIHGDYCNTVLFAQQFLTASGQCERDCPSNFLSVNGYPAQTIRNVGFLLKSGKERCAGNSGQEATGQP